MSSFRAPFWIVVAAGLLPGCVVTPEGKVALKMFYKEPSKAEATAKTDSKEKEKSTTTAEKSDNPFRKQDGDSSKSAEAKTETASTKSDAATDDPVAKAKGGGTLSAETLKLIDEQLADATPDERADWYEQLKRVDPAVIPQILQARRMSMQITAMKGRSDFDTDADEPARDSRTGTRRRGRDSDRDSRRNQSTDIELASRQIPDDDDEPPATRDRARQALYQTDPNAPRDRMAAQDKPGQSNQGPFAVHRISHETPGAEGAATGTANSQNPAGRQGLSRFLQRGLPGTSPQIAANSPSAVSLLPPTGADAGTGPYGLDQLISETEAEVARMRPGTTEQEQTAYLQQHVYLRLLYLMADHPERALSAIPGAESADQEFWQQLLWSIANYFDTQHIPAAKDRASQSVAQLMTATQRLREQAGLELRNMAFCRQINYYGNFERFPRDEFRPGQEALLYAEIENFKSELTADGQYRTLLKSTIEIISPSGEVRWQKEFPATEDLCNNYRRDYFHNYQFSIPERMPLGPHKLKLTVFDELSGKVISQSINFLVR